MVVAVFKLQFFRIKFTINEFNLEKVNFAGIAII